MKKLLPTIFLALFAFLMSCSEGDQTTTTNYLEQLPGDFNSQCYWENNSSVQDECARADEGCIAEHWVDVGSRAGLEYMCPEESSSVMISSTENFSNSLLSSLGGGSSDSELSSNVTSSVTVSSSAEGSSSSNGSSSSSEVSSSSSVVSSSSAVFVCGGILTDARDAQSYATTQIGTQCLMTENLNYAASGSYCYVDNTANCDTYGRIYTWTTAMDGASSSSATPSGVQGVCPEGWHLPSDNEWEVLAEYVANESGLTGKSNDDWTEIGKLLKANSSLWNTNTGTDAYGFAGLPGGHRDSDGSFYGEGNYGYWWSTTESSSTRAYRRSLDYLNDLFDRDYRDKTNAYSVRCIMDK